MSFNNATYIPYFVLQSYMLVYDYSWEHIIIMFLIIASQLVATFVFEYMMLLLLSYMKLTDNVYDVLSLSIYELYVNISLNRCIYLSYFDITL